MQTGGQVATIPNLSDMAINYAGRDLVENFRRHLKHFTVVLSSIFGTCWIFNLAPLPLRKSAGKHARHSPN